MAKKPIRFRDVIRVVSAVFMPPLGVFLTVGFGWSFWLSLLLTFAGFVPGIVHAIWVIARHSSESHD